jgi:hypothetical protein
VCFYIKFLCRTNLPLERWLEAFSFSIASLTPDLLGLLPIVNFKIAAAGETPLFFERNFFPGWCSSGSMSRQCFFLGPQIGAFTLDHNGSSSRQFIFLGNIFGPLGYYSNGRATRQWLVQKIACCPLHQRFIFVRGGTAPTECNCILLLE